MIQKNMKALVLICLFVFGCASGDKQGSKDAAAPESQLKKQVKDVPFQARRDESSPRKRLMVLPFLDTSEARPQKMRDQARAEFIRSLNGTGEVIVIDSQELKLDLNKQLRNGEYNLAEVAKAAFNLGVNVVLEGKVMDLKVTRKADPVGIFRQMTSRFEAVVRVRMVLSKSGKEIFNTTKTVTLEEKQNRVAENVNADKMLQTNPELLEKLMMDAFTEFNKQLLAAMDKVAWEGRIALINGDRVFINVGRVSGLQIGDILKVSEDGDEIYDPQSGNYIGKSGGRLKGTLEVISYFGQDGSITLIHSGAGFKENDRVELY